MALSLAYSLRADHILSLKYYGAYVQSLQSTEIQDHFPVSKRLWPTLQVSLWSLCSSHSHKGPFFVMSLVLSNTSLYAQNLLPGLPSPLPQSQCLFFLQVWIWWHFFKEPSLTLILGCSLLSFALYNESRILQTRCVVFLIPTTKYLAEAS